LFSFRNLTYFTLGVVGVGLSFRFFLWGFSVPPETAHQAVTVMAESVNDTVQTLLDIQSRNQAAIIELANRNPAGFSVLTQPASNDPQTYSLALLAGALIMKLISKK
jgi:hypothetical protein